MSRLWRANKRVRNKGNVNLKKTQFCCIASIINLQIKIFCEVGIVAIGNELSNAKETLDCLLIHPQDIITVQDVSGVSEVATLMVSLCDFPTPFDGGYSTSGTSTDGVRLVSGALIQTSLCPNFLISYLVD